MKTITSEQGARIRERRLALGLTQMQLAERIGVSRGYVSQVEKGIASPPSTNILTRWSQALEWPGDAMKKLLGTPTRESTDSVGLIDSQPTMYAPTITVELREYIEDMVTRAVREALEKAEAERQRQMAQLVESQWRVVEDQLAKQTRALLISETKVEPVVFGETRESTKK